jgi:hypothetical protein
VKPDIGSVRLISLSLKDKTMINPQRGRKHTCQDSACQKPFYDLGQTVFSCPYCETPFVAQGSQALAHSAPASGFARGSRRKPQIFKIVSPETAQELLRDKDTAVVDGSEGDAVALLEESEE